MVSKWWTRRAVLGAALSIVLLAPVAVLAHGLLRSSVPKAGETVQLSPADLVLTFTERPEQRFTSIRLFGPQGAIALGPLRISGEPTVAAAVPAQLPNGSYRVEWITAGLDGHPVSGSYAFVLAVPGQPMPTDSLPLAVDSALSSAAGELPTMTGTAPSSLATLLRWLTLAGVIGLIGAVTFRATVIARVSLEIDREIASDYLPAASRAAAKLGALSAMIIIAAAVARLVLQSQLIHGNASALDSALLTSMLLETSWGRGWIAHVVAATIALAAFAVVARRPRRAGWLVAGAAAGALAFSLAAVSHAAALPRFAALSVVANAIHVIAAAGWLGSLLMLFAVGLPLALRLDRADRWTVVRDIVHTFSPAALAFSAIAVATGVVMTWTHVRTLDNLVGSDYGRILLLKLTLLGVTAGVGAYNWRRVRPSLRNEHTVARLRGSTAVELTLAAMVIAVTAVLIAIPLPSE